MNNLKLARKVADAVLYEGYLLYPYRASAAKNRLRWQFGVIVPRGYSAGGASEPWFMQTECLVEPGEASALDCKVRFLQLETRTVETVIDAEGDRFRPVEAFEFEGERFVTWEDGVEREIDIFGLNLAEVLAAERCVPLSLPGNRATELIRGKTGKIAGRIVRERWPISAVVRVAAEALGTLVKMRIGIENLSQWPAELAIDRNLALRRSLLGAHTLLQVLGGVFVSLLDPPQWARTAAAACVNLHTWPVLIGDARGRDLLLSSPIILYDHPQVAPESPGDLFDATEIDEILTLRTMTLTDEEKREARRTDRRAAAIIDRSDTMPAEILARLHGAIRYRRQAPADTEQRRQEAPWSNPTVDRSASPGTDSIRIGDFAVSKGSRVRLHPGRRRTDAQDIFLEGRVAIVEAVLFDLEDNGYLAVTLADDPAADLYRWQGRFLYFAPEEVEPLDSEG